MDKEEERVYHKPRCPKCGFQSCEQNIRKHMNSKKDVCKKYLNIRTKILW